MLLVMGVTLFTSRIVLDALGETNYGIYNVVGGVVTMFGFFSSISSGTCQRYFSYELGKKNTKGLAKIFKLNMTVFIIIALGILLMAETIGLWFINNKLTIPIERLFAANIVYQSAIFSFFLIMILIPYKSLIIAHERMSQFAYISIIEVILKLALAITLLYLGKDKLILYAIMMLCSQIIITFCYYIYCRRNFIESKYHFCWDSKKIKEILAYSGWHQFGALSVVVRNQGVSILVNMFFNPVINAGRAISLQVTAATDSLSNNFFVAAKPQIYKYYALGQYDNLYKLINRSTKVCFFLILILAVPIVINCEFVLSLWLKDVPTYAVLFTQLSLINAIIDSSNGPAIAAALASAKIKKFELVTAGIMLLNLPISYIVLMCGGLPENVVLISIILSIITVIVRAYLLKQIINLSVKEYLVYTCLPLFCIAIVSIILFYSLYQVIEVNMFNLLLSSFTNMCICGLLCYIFAMNNLEKAMIKRFIFSKIIKK